MINRFIRTGGFLFLSIATAFPVTVRFVSVNSATPAAPYTSWASAATSIQDAIDVAVAGDQVLVTNGVYNTGGRIVQGSLSNRVVIDKAITLQSVNGAAVTMIEGNPEMGDSAIRCVYMTNQSTLLGFTLTNGTTRLPNDEPFEEQSAGGVWCNSYDVLVQDCVLVSNVAPSDAGGAYGGVLNHCTFINNSGGFGGGAEFALISDCLFSNNVAIYAGYGYGGGAADSFVTNCVFIGNASDDGGAVGYSTLVGCLLTNNTSPYGGGAFYSTLTDCVLATNFAGFIGGGASYCVLNNCTLTDNFSDQGGAAYYSTLQGCVLVDNFAFSGGGGANGGSLNHCVLSGNSSSFGGGVVYASLESCVLSNNFAFEFNFSGNYGGGAAYCNLTNCLITGNSSAYGAGADSSLLESCTIVGNTADTDGGGVNNSTLVNSIIYNNFCPFDANCASGFLDYCCTTPLPGAGAGNFTNAPVFVDPVNGDFRMAANSPCINGGNSNYVILADDLDGNTRIVSTMVDVGAYEFQSPASTISYVWLLQHGLPINGSADNVDSDGDGVDNFHEWLANTDPTNAAMVFRLISISKDESGVTITWTSAPDRLYTIERSSDLGEMPAFSIYRADLSGESGTNKTSYLDFDTEGQDHLFYRVSSRFGPPPPPAGS